LTSGEKSDINCYKGAYNYVRTKCFLTKKLLNKDTADKMYHYRNEKSFHRTNTVDTIWIKFTKLY